MIEFPPRFWQWIAEHANDDPMRLRLSAARYPDPWVGEGIGQIERRNRASKKIPHALSHAAFYIPTDLSVEQSTGEALAAYHASRINDGDRVVDLTAGLGIDVLAMARRAKSVVAVERDPEVADALRHNAAVMGMNNVTVVCADCTEWVKTCDEHFDVCFIDPARRGEHGERIYSVADCRPNVVAMLDDLRRMASRLIAKLSPMLDISDTAIRFGCATRIMALGTTTECKELVAECALVPDEAHDLSVAAVTVRTGKEASAFTFTPAAEANAAAEYAMPTVGQHLYMPYPAVMKVGATKLICERYGLCKPSVNTHLYYGTEAIDGFPGERYDIVDVLPYSSSVIKRLSKRMPRAMVGVRNMGITAEALRRKLKISDGGDMRIIGFSAADSSRHLIISAQKRGLWSDGRHAP